MKREKGAVMVEAVILFPVIMLTVFFLIYLSLFQLQEIAIMYQVQRVAHQGAMHLASPGYETLGNYRDKKIDFESSPADVNAYYQAHHDNLLVLYREIFGYNSWTSEDDVQGFMDSMKEDTMILAGMTLFDNDVTIKRGLLSTEIYAEVSFGLPTPGLMRYIGFDETELRFKQGASASAVSPSGVVRTVDLASEAMLELSEKLGIKDDLSKIMDGINKYLF